MTAHGRMVSGGFLVWKVVNALFGGFIDAVGEAIDAAAEGINSEDND
jgi:hypothetical protein